MNENIPVRHEKTPTVLKKRI